MVWKKFEKALLAFMTGTFPVFIAACYGVAMDDEFYGPEDVDINGTVTNASGTPLPNILVTCLESNDNSTYTLEGDGSFSLSPHYLDECATLRFEDVDGEQNGGLFAPLEYPIGTREQEDLTDLSITLELEE